MLKYEHRTEDKLPFPTRLLKTQGGMVEECIIPEDRKAEVLKELCLYDPVRIFR